MKLIINSLSRGTVPSCPRSTRTQNGTLAMGLHLADRKHIWLIAYAVQAFEILSTQGSLLIKIFRAAAWLQGERNVKPPQSLNTLTSSWTAALLAPPAPRLAHLPRRSSCISSLMCITAALTKTMLAEQDGVAEGFKAVVSSFTCCKTWAESSWELLGGPGWFLCAWRESRAVEDEAQRLRVCSAFMGQWQQEQCKLSVCKPRNQGKFIIKKTKTQTTNTEQKVSVDLHISILIQEEEMFLHAESSWTLELLARGCGCGESFPGLKRKLR